MNIETLRTLRARALWFGVTLAAFSWFLAPLWLIPSGVEAFEGEAPAVAVVAKAAYESALSQNDNPLGRLLTPAARVQRVWKEPGHCAASEPGGRQPYADYRATVRFYSYFGIPGRVIHITCGGWAWSS